MKIQVLKENLLRATQIASRFCATKTQLPILGNLALYAEPEGIFMMGSDLTRSVSVRVGGKVIEGGSILVPAKILNELIQALPLGVVEIEVAGKEVMRLRAGKVKVNLQGMVTEDYPRLKYDKEAYTQRGEQKVKDWEWVMERLGYAISRDEARPVLTGALWDTDRGVVVATDGYRLGIVEGRVEKIGVGRLIIPGGLLGEAIKIMGEAGVEKVGVSYNKETKEMMFVSEDVLVWGRLLEGEFPKYEAIIPQSYAMKVRLVRDELLRAVKVAAIFARESAHIVTLGFDEAGVEVSANAPQVGDEVVVVDAVVVEGVAKGKIAFNSKYLIDYLAAKGASEVVFGMNDQLQPGVFIEGKAGNYRHVIMPVRVRGKDAEVSS